MTYCTNQELDYAKRNFVAFLESHGMKERFIELANRKLAPAKPTNSNDIFVRIFAMALRPTSYIDWVCTWREQPEGLEFWNNLNEKWRQAAILKKEMAPKSRKYKSIW